jgi:hypothetical protein
MAFWIFKCDPKRYSLTDRMADPTPGISWLVTRYKKEIAPGDTVFLMESGPRRSIRAVMRVDAGPGEMGELEGEQAYWAERDTETRCRVLGTITHRVDLPVEELKSVDGLQDLSIFHGVQQGTNFRVTDKEGEILMSLVERVASK